MNECLFCKIATKDIEAVVLYEDFELVAFLDIHPIREGHAQIIPKAPFDTFELLPPELAAKTALSTPHRFAFDWRRGRERPEALR